MIKYYRFSYDYVLWEISYVNLIMLQATIDTYDGLDDEIEQAEKKPKANQQTGFDEILDLI